MPLILSTLNCCRAAVVAWVGPPTRIGVVKKPTLEFFFGKKQKNAIIPCFIMFPILPFKIFNFFWKKDRKIWRHRISAMLGFPEIQISDATALAWHLASEARGIMGSAGRAAKATFCRCRNRLKKLQSCDTTGCIYIYTYVHIILVWFQKKKNIYQL